MNTPSPNIISRKITHLFYEAYSTVKNKICFMSEYRSGENIRDLSTDTLVMIDNRLSELVVTKNELIENIKNIFNKNKSSVSNENTNSEIWSMDIEKPFLVRYSEADFPVSKLEYEPNQDNFYVTGFSKFNYKHSPILETLTINSLITISNNLSQLYPNER